VAGFVRRFTSFPTIDVIQQIEGVVIVDLTPAGTFTGIAQGTLGLVGEWQKGYFNTPTEVFGDQSIRSNFGTFVPSVIDSLAATVNRFSKGNAFCWLKDKKFARLILVRPNLTLSAGVTITLGGTLPGSATVVPPGRTIVLAAGTRIVDPAAPTHEFALAQDIVWGPGTDLGGSGSTAWPSAGGNPLLAPLTTPIVTGVPVYSTQGVAGTSTDVTLVNAQDLLQFSGIGTGGQYPSLTVAVVNPATLTPLNSTQVDNAYLAAITSTLPGNDPAGAIQVIASARESANIRAALLQNAITSAQSGLGRIALLRPPIGTVQGSSSGQLYASTDPGVGAYRSDRAIMCYPHFVQRITDIADQFPSDVVSTAFNAQPGQVLIGADAAMASILSQLPSEANPGQATGLIEYINDLEPGLTTPNAATKFVMDDYIAMKRNGVAGLRRDSRIAQWVFESGVTTVDPTVNEVEAPVSRRRFADEVEDSLAAIALIYSKKVATQDRKDTFLGEAFNYLDSLESPDQPALQRIEDFSIDSKSGNSKQLNGLGIYVIITTVRQLGTMDDIVVQATIGPTVTVQATP